jgi:hypothetical protein
MSIKSLQISRCRGDEDANVSLLGCSLMPCGRVQLGDDELASGD